MDLKQLEYVENIVKYGTMREAARKLFVTEPTISQQVKKLEKSLGIKIFEKQGRNIYLTSEGKEILPYMDNILEETYKLKAHINELKEPDSGQIRFGVGPITANTLLSNLFNEFNTAYPNVKFNIFQGGAIELINMVADNRLDIAVIGTTESTRKGLREQKLNYKILTQTKFSIVVSSQHPFSSKRTVKLEELTQEQFIFYRNSLLIERVLSSLGLEIEDKLICLTDSVSSTCQFIKIGLGISLLPDFYINSLTPHQQEGLHILEIEDKEIILEPCCIYKKDRYLPQYMKLFIKKVSQHILSK